MKSETQEEVSAELQQEAKSVEVQQRTTVITSTTHHESMNIQNTNIQKTKRRSTSKDLLDHGTPHHGEQYPKTVETIVTDIGQHFETSSLIDETS